MTINGHEYTVPAMDFKSMCKLEKMGINLSEMGNMPMTVMAGFMALAMNASLDEAMDEIQNHIADGGVIDDIATPFNKALEESGFLSGVRGKKSKKKA